MPEIIDDVTNAQQKPNLPHPSNALPWDSILAAASELGKKYIDKKYGHDSKHLMLHVLLVAILLIGIIVAAIITNLDSTVIGTLIGSLTGYSFGKFGANSGNSRNDG